MRVRSALCLVLSAAVVCLAGCSEGPMGGAKEPKFRFAKIERADVFRTVEATGTVTPRNTKEGIPVGAQVNGRIIKLFVDYNSIVTNGQVVALIDPLVYEATYKSAVAQLHSNQAKLVLAEKTLVRKQNLFAKQMCSEADLDQAVETRDTTKAAVEQSEAAVSKAKADLDYCTLRSPVDGVVIARKVEEGETVVSSYNAVPVLTIAEDLKVVWVEATVPEADVGNIKVGQEVTFTADAYRRKFKGKVKQVRKAHTTTNNVVTYPIIIEAENPDEMLFPGMTATLSIETARAENAVVVSAAAFRFRPKEEDREEGELPRGRKIWIVGEGGKLKPIVVKDGVSDTTVMQILEHDELEGQEAVIGYETPATLAAKKDDTTNPFKQKFPQRNKNRGTAPEPKK